MNRQVADRERYLGSGNAIGVAAAALARRPAGPNPEKPRNSSMNLSTSASLYHLERFSFTFMLARYLGISRDFLPFEFYAGALIRSQISMHA